MDDETILPDVAGDEAVVEDITEVEDEGQDEGQESKTAEESKAEETKSKSQKRRKNRAAEMQRLQEDELGARQAAEAVQRRLDDSRRAAQALPRPKQADYPDFEEYQAALSAFHSVGVLDKREQQKLEAEAKQHFDRAGQVKQAKKDADAQNWAAHLEEGKSRYPDFVEVFTSPQLHVAPKLAEHVFNSDVAADVAYFLGKNPAISSAMSGMGEIDMARAFGRLEAQVSAPKPKTVSTAPDPITPLNGRATAGSKPEQMSPDNYRKWRAAGNSF